MYPKIDYSDLENIEPVPGSRLEGCKIVGHYRGHYRRDSDAYSHLVIAKDANGVCEAVNLTYDGREWPNSPPVIRNKPKRVTLEEVWVIYKTDGVWYSSTSSADTASEYRKHGYIVRHIPAEEREV